ncbi:hypothetical protein [Acidisphaera sp. S103]|uniref:hypothetical protein n=1 Tax=Acidisphaera sp. S103 TaxID=1747223 RepID=UPI00131A8C87|nr:hypothetical protein [Acidisphaera sp. S103]
MEFATAWEAVRPSIYRLLLTAGVEDRSNLCLPDDDIAFGAKRIRWVEGAEDGVFLKHGYDINRAADAEIAIIASAVMSAARDPIEPHVVSLYQLLMDDQAVRSITSVLSLLSERDVEMVSELAMLGRWLATEAPDRQPVKFGLALLGRFGNPLDINVILCIGQHEEFTLYAADAIVELMTNPDPWLWSLAKKVHGWGRIHTVDRLSTTTDPAIKGWMLRSGYKNSVMYEYLAYQCATSGELLTALQQREPDEALLEGARDIIEALLAGGPAKSMTDYEDGAEVVQLYMRHVASRIPDNIAVFRTIQSILTHVDDGDTDWSVEAHGCWTENVRRQIALDAAEILAREEWREIVDRGLLSNDEYIFSLAASAIDRLGGDAWQVRHDRQRRLPTTSQWYWLMQSSDPDQIDQVLVTAEEQIDLAAIASGPEEALGLGAEFKQHQVLDWLLHALSRFPGKGWRFIAAGVRSPVIRNRNFALRAAAHWGSAAWPPGGQAIIERARAEETNTDLYLKFANVLDGRPFTDGIVRHTQPKH